MKWLVTKNNVEFEERINSLMNINKSKTMVFENTKRCVTISETVVKLFHIISML